MLLYIQVEILQFHFHKHMVSHVAEHDPLFNTYSEHYIKAKQYGQGDYVKEHDDCGNVKLKGKIHHIAYSCLLYLNDSHGGELIVDGKEIEITKGTFIIFPAEIFGS